METLKNLSGGQINELEQRLDRLVKGELKACPSKEVLDKIRNKYGLKTEKQD